MSGPVMPEPPDRPEEDVEDDDLCLVDEDEDKAPDKGDDEEELAPPDNSEEFDEAPDLGGDDGLEVEAPSEDDEAPDLNDSSEWTESDLDMLLRELDEAPPVPEGTVTILTVATDVVSHDISVAAARALQEDTNETVVDRPIPFIEIQLLDPDGKPVGGAKYYLHQQAGGDWNEVAPSATLDGDGSVRVEDDPLIENGVCRIRFVFDQDEDAAQLEDEDRFVEVELQDASGKPVKGFAYRIAHDEEVFDGDLADGKTGRHALSGSSPAASVIFSLAAASQEAAEDEEPFVEVELLDADGQAVEGFQYRIFCTEDEDFSGDLSAGASGKKTVSGDAPTARVSFCFSPATIAADEEEEDCVIELQNADGSPAEYHKIRVAKMDGEVVFAGAVNKQGEYDLGAKHLDVPDCRISFPPDL